MTYRQIKSYDDFTAALLEAGFSMGSGNSEGIYSIIPWDWNEAAPYDTPVRWHTGDPETDPWEWRMRVLDERTDIAYAKLFFNKSGYITREWAPCFLAARREGLSFGDDYEAGKVSRTAKRIYDVVREHEILPLHIIKQVAGFGKEDKSQFDRALTELQIKMHLTMCGRQQKLSQKGEAYGWSSTMFCTTERFWGEEVFAEAAKLEKEEAIAKITRRILTLNPEAIPRKIEKFIKG